MSCQNIYVILLTNINRVKKLINFEPKTHKDMFEMIFGMSLMDYIRENFVVLLDQTT